MGRNPDPRQSLGRAGEEAAERELARAGLLVLARRFRCRWGELDLVARDGEVVVFVEVKTRRGDEYGTPAAAVDPRKTRRISRAARAYLWTHGLGEPRCRFDVVEVVATPDGAFLVRHLRDAFRPVERP